MPKRLVPRVEEENLLRAFLEHISDGAYFKDRESRFVRISRSLAARFGLSDPAEAINKTDFDMFSEEHAKQASTVLLHIPPMLIVAWVFCCDPMIRRSPNDRT